MIVKTPFAVDLKSCLAAVRFMICGGVAGFLVVGRPGLSEAQAVNTPNEAVFQIQTRMDALETVLRDLTGKLEEAQYKNRQLEMQLEQLNKDVEFRFQQLEKPGGAGADGSEVTVPKSDAAEQQGTGAFPPKDEQTGVLGYIRGESSGEATQPQSPVTPQQERPSSPSVPQVVGTPEQQYTQAFELLRVGDYAAAEKAFTVFLQKNPKHALAGNAQYWLGETYYVRGDYKSASVAFLDGYRQYPTNSKAPDNLLKLGLSMAQLGGNQEACAAFKKIGAEYPKVSEAVNKRAVQEITRLGCK